MGAGCPLVIQSPAWVTLHDHARFTDGETEAQSTAPGCRRHTETEAVLVIMNWLFLGFESEHQRLKTEKDVPLAFLGKALSQLERRQLPVNLAGEHISSFSSLFTGYETIIVLLRRGVGPSELGTM